MTSRRLVVIAAALLTLLSFIHPARAQAVANPAAPRIADDVSLDALGAKGVLVVHYRRPASDYADWNLWTWTPGAQGRQINFTGVTEFGVYALVPVTPGAQRQGLILRRGQWEAKDGDQDRFAALDADGRTEIWLVAGDTAIHTDPSTINLTTRITAAFLDDADTIQLATTGPLSPDQFSALRLTGGAQPYTISSLSIPPDARPAAGMIQSLTLDRPVAFEDVARLSLTIPGVPQPLTVYARDILNEDRFTALDADLGSRHEDHSTTFRVWSPVSERVDVLLFAADSAAEPTREIPMTHAGRGVWEVQIAGDLHGVAYQYRYHSYGQSRIAADIHSFAATPDSARSVVVDLSRTNPDGWGSTPQPRLKQLTDEVIYEVHVRDTSVADESMPENLRGTYLGLIHDGSIQAGAHQVRTGLGNLKELGVTAVHLLPIHDFTARPDEYNWGYWTALFNVPESNYATDRADPTSPIRDLKTTVQGLHAAGIRVILDVVYNHTSTSGEWSPFHQSVPYYYFRTTIDGRPRNDAGVGNSIADERPMVRKYISDSLAFWTTQYRVDGFRFDLLGTHTPESVAAWTSRLRSLRPDLTIYGEPWTGGGPILFGKGAQRGLGLAVFNDHFRNALRGDLDGMSTGFATGPGGDRAAVIRGIMGSIDDFTADPTETINYVSAHDNLTFYDKLLKAQPAAGDDTHRAMQRLAYSVILTSQGIPFLHAGCETARTKGGNHNSYNAGDEVNRIDWPRKAEYRDLFDYVRGLIALRRAHPAFRMTTADDVRAAISPLPSPPGAVILYTIDGARAGDSWQTILVAHNGEPKPVEFTLPPGSWAVVVDDRNAGVDTRRIVAGRHTLPPYSSAVMHRISN